MKLQSAKQQSNHLNQGVQFDAEKTVHFAAELVVYIRAEKVVHFARNFQWLWQLLLKMV